MSIFALPKAAFAVTILALLAPSVSAHSWVEYAYKLAPNGTLMGEMGFPRGFLPRNSTSPPFTDSIPQNILPVAGQGSYSGDEILNKYKLDKNPQYPMLEAAPGDYIALMHLENGHTTIPQNQPLKPLNRGTIFFYGTTEPKENEKLFDVHLLWNKKGTGGDGRGKLLATRNYDDGQCYQDNTGDLAKERAQKFADLGAVLNEELKCQSDIKLPDDLPDGSIYTIYWYWDWPNLNADAIDFAATKNGVFPWAGTFMRGEKDPHGFTMDAIAKNESYSSVIDIKIVGTKADNFAIKDKSSLDWVEKQNIYSMGIKEQMESNFQVDIDGASGGSTGGSSVAAPSATLAPTTAISSVHSSGVGGVATVTVTTTVQPPVSISTVFVTVPAEPSTQPVSSAGPSIATTTTTTLFRTLSSTPSSVSEPATIIPTASTVTTTAFVTLSKSTPAVAEPSTSVQSMTTTPSSAPSDATPSSNALTTSTVTLTKTTTSIASSTALGSAPSDAASSSYPGGEFRETPVPTTTSTAPAGPPTPSGFLRQRGNWAFGDF
ncbi:hypothetical protein G7046_g1159 [Stylonectria norvegica]|nr:hypothetical protein G7046_g1159 [Stylonectria norvegica]